MTTTFITTTSNAFAFKLRRAALTFFASAAALALFGSFEQPACAIPADGLVGWWRADGNALDSAGTHNGTTPWGMTYAPGVVGQAFSMTEGHMRVLIPDGPDFKLTSSLTIEGWIYPKSNTGTVFFRGDSRSGWDSYLLTAFTPGKLTFSITADSGAAAILEAPIQYNKWQHIAATLDGGTGKMDLYVNGVLGKEIITSVRPYANLTGSNPTVAIGGVDALNTFPFDGMIDEMALYSRALSQGEIQGIINAVPEPGSMALLGLGALAAFLRTAARRTS